MRIFTILVFFMIAALTANAADLSIPSVTAQPETTTVRSEIHFATQGMQIAGIQVDVLTDPKLVISAQLGAAASASGKQLSTNTVPDGIRLLIVGLNQNTIADGTIVTLTITLPGGASGQYPIRLENAAATDASGKSIPLSTTNGNIVVKSNEVGSLVKRGALVQVASGGCWKSSVSIINTTAQPNTFRLEFRSDTGDRLSFPVTFPQLGNEYNITTSTIERTIDPNALLIIETEAPCSGPIMVGWASLLSSAETVAYSVFRQRNQEGKDFEAVVPLGRVNQNSALMPFDNADGFLTGVALINTSETSSSEISIMLRDEHGAVLLSTSMTLPILGHRAFFLGDVLQAARGRRGTIELKSNGPSINALGLRFNPMGGSFTSIPSTNF